MSGLFHILMIPGVGGGSAPAVTYRFQLEDGSGYFILEDASGYFIQEAAP